MSGELWVLGALVIVSRLIYDICRHLASMERARVRREEWEVYAELQTRGLDPEPPGEGE